MPERDSDFYVGHDPTMPPALARFLAPRIAALLFAIPLVLGSVAAFQGGFLFSLFEFGQEREFVGFLSEKPVPALVVLRPGDAERCGSTSTYPLVAPGKHGAAAAIAGLEGRPARLRGTLIHLDGAPWIELSASEAVRPLDAPGSPVETRRAVRTESLGFHRLVGEIVDSKCHYGVMNPGSGKVHRACAVRCISGGIPPSFLIRDRAGKRATLLLVDRTGRGVSREVLAWVGRPVVVAGAVIRHDDLLVFEIDPGTIRAHEADR